MSPTRMTNMLIASIGKDLEQTELLHVASGNVKWQDTSEKSLESS